MRNSATVALFLSALTALCSACGKPKQRNPDARRTEESLRASERQPITGIVIDTAGIANARLELRLVRGRPAPADTTTYATAIEKGRFSIVPRDAGPYELVAYLPLEPDTPYVAFISEDPRESVVVSPLSTITAGLIRHQRQMGPIGDMELASRFAAMSAHFQIPKFEYVEPAVLPMPVDTNPVTAPVQAQLVVQALERIAKSFIDDSKDNPMPPSLAHLCNVLAEDLEADGILDGRGHDGKRLKLAGSGYDGSLLRSQLAQHLLDVVSTSAQTSTASLTKRDQYCHIARKVVHSSQPAIGQPHFPEQFSCQTQHITVNGKVPFMGPERTWQVDAWSIDSEGLITQRRSSSTVDATNHNFTLEIDGDSGPLLIRAYPQGHDATNFFRYVLPPGQNRNTLQISLNPLSTISSAYTRGLLRQGKRPLNETIDLAGETLSQHFGTDVHAIDISSDFNVVNWLTADAPLSDNDRASLLCVAMGHLSDINSKFSVDTRFRDLRLLQLTSLLVEDVSADASFDGAGETRRSLSLEGYPISSSTIRADLSRSILSYLQSAQSITNPDHQNYLSSTSAQDAQSWARSLVETTQAPFTTTLDIISTQGPSFVGRCVVREGANRRPLSEILRGVICVECSLEPGSFLSNANISVQVADRNVGGDGDGNTIIPSADSNNRTLLSFLVDTREISKLGGSETSAVLTIVASNTLGAIEKTTFDLVIDNTKPTIDCSTCEINGCTDSRNNVWVGRGEMMQADIQVSGRPPFELSAESPSLTVTLSTKIGVDTIIGNDILVRTYHVTAERPALEQSAKCAIDITVKDGADNESKFSLLARWSDNGPAFAKPGITSIAFDHFKNNAVQPPEILSEHSFNAVFHRYANHLDYDEAHGLPPASDPLPVLRFHFNHDDHNALPAELVEYRATPYRNKDFIEPIFMEPTPWRTAHVPTSDHPSVFFLPLSFQTLLPEHLLNNPTTARAMARLLMHNQEGTSPAPWKIEVRATDQYGNASYREAYIVFDVRLPPVVMIHTPAETGWCGFNVTQAAQQPHADIDISNVHWPMLYSEHSLFTRPDLRVDYHFSIPPVTRIDKTEWFIERIGRPTVGAKGKDKNKWENKKAVSCERLLNRNFHGLWIENWDRCIPFENASFYDKSLLAGSDLFPLHEEQKEWIVTNFAAPKIALIDSTTDRVTTITSKEPAHHRLLKQTTIHKSGISENVRPRLSESKALVYGDGKREERWFHEYIAGASTTGQVRWDFTVNDPFLKLDMEKTWITRDISCQLQPSPPWIRYDWEHQMHGIPVGQMVPDPITFIGR